MDSDTSRFRRLPHGRLQVVQTEKGDAGIYTCIATNAVGTAEATVKLEFKGEE